MADIKEVHTGAARAIVQKIYESDLYTPTWARWRNWAQVPKRTVWLSIDQLRFLVAVAWIRKTQRLQGVVPVELNAFDVLCVAHSEEITAALTNAFNEIESKGLVLGRDLPGALKLRGLLISQQMLYRKIKNFSTSKYYPVNELANALKIEYAMRPNHA